MKKIAAMIMLALLAWAGPGGAQEIKIGLMCPLTGDWAQEGRDMQRFLEMQVEDLNAAGGIKGIPVRLIVADDGGNPRSANLAAQRLVESQVAAVVGTYGSAVTEASQGIYDEAKVVQIANGSTAIRLTEKHFTGFFRTCTRDDFQGRAVARAVTRLGFRKVALVHDNSSYAKGLAVEVEPLLQAAGVEIVYYDALTPGERDYSTIITKMKTLSPEAVVFTGYYPEAGMILRQMQEMGWKVPIIGGDATNNLTIVEIAGREAAAGYYFISPPGPQDLSGEEAKAFMAEYEAKYGQMPGSIFAVLAGDAFKALVKAITEAGSDYEAISSYLHNDLKNFDGFTGPIAFDAKGDRVGDLFRLYRIDGEGKFVLQP
ncbi:MAG: branched-chain amino acid ABC transporter substrate-binding protein [Desulfarculales bacterium]|jgi:branched-chain amino acid transport system substrate-binding protein|nr:branched-chain amino acid ABC transporter substrate-binding protein [Desulfarculales bacterium]